MDERIVVLALTGAFDSPSTRLRIIRMSTYLKDYSIEVKIFRYPKSPIDLVKILKNEDYHIIWLQKRLPDFFKKLIFKFNKIPIIFDFDDNLTVKMKPKKGSYDSFTRRIKFNSVKKLASAFTCGNNFLRQLISEKDKPVLIYPTPVPIDVPQKKNYSFNKIRIGWVGLSGGFMYLERIFPQLEKLYSEIEFEFIVISDRLFKPEFKFVKNIEWKLETQESEIAKFDIGIMPLNTNSPYDKGKCSYKILQYMAAGVVPVGEAYGTNLDVIKHKRNGFLIYNNSWYEGLKEIIHGMISGTIDYERLSKEAKKTAIKNYSFETLSKKLADFFYNIYEQRS